VVAPSSPYPRSLPCRTSMVRRRAATSGVNSLAAAPNRAPAFHTARGAELRRPDYTQNDSQVDCQSLAYCAGIVVDFWPLVDSAQAPLIQESTQFQLPGTRILIGPTE
jgi:hypothetical protein